jgi:hypothetical protein
MKFEQLRLITPEYTSLIDELRSTSEEIMDKYPDFIETTHLRQLIFLKTPNCNDNQSFTLSRNKKYPNPENPEWSEIEPEIGYSDIYGDGSGTVADYGFNKGLLTAFWSEFDNNEIDGSVAPTEHTLTIEEINKLLDDFKAAKPFKDRKEQRPKVNDGRISSFVSSTIRLFTRNK